MQRSQNCHELLMGDGRFFLYYLYMLPTSLNPDRTMSLSPYHDLRIGPAEKAQQRVLVVDDEENVGLIVQQGLKKLPNFTVKLARSAEQALHLCREAPFDLMITDYRMPGTDGIALASQIREMYPQTIILMLSAQSDDELHQQAAQVAVRQIFDKPVEISEIREAVRRALEEEGC